MAHRFPSAERDRLKDERRRVIQPAERIIDHMSPHFNEICMDLGSGTGYIAIPLSLRVSKVIALDAQRDMLKTLLDDAGGKNNIETVVAEASHIPLVDSSFDRIVLTNVLHEIDDIDYVVDDIRRILKPGGHVSLIDFPKRPTSMGPPVRERLDIEEVITIFDKFHVVNRWEFTEYYQVEFKKS
ncbi:MAG: class I SAM-dependent methyltransferase [Euryarchaeota archaeon]|nr:class I SAM-dependent methyltransferase [Euryarchaeota archaeon]